ncbi:MAG: S49 family peptidase [Dehalococcoidia bacterium]
MGKLATVWEIAHRWYVSLLLAAGVGALIGYLVFFVIFPGKPQIGIIDIPSVVLTQDSAFVITALLDHARKTDSIKAVVIGLDSPGGSSAASEQLFLEMRKLRQKKPVVIGVNGLAASGAYMVSLGANYTYAKPTSLVGSVGVAITSPGPLLPSAPSERLISTGPFKLSGGYRRQWIGLLDELKEAFVQMVLAERGDRLRMSAAEIADGRIYTGIEGVRIGLVDAIGTETDAIEKAASLAGVSRYDVVDVNAEVLPLFFQRLRRIVSSLEGAGGQPSLKADGPVSLEEITNLGVLRSLFLPSGVGESQEDVLPGFPLKVNPPNIYYLYVGPSQ